MWLSPSRRIHAISRVMEDGLLAISYRLSAISCASLRHLRYLRRLHAVVSPLAGTPTPRVSLHLVRRGVRTPTWLPRSRSAAAAHRFWEGSSSHEDRTPPGC